MCQIIETLKQALTNNTCAFHLTSKEVSFMNDILNDHPEIFGKIQGTIEEIISDGKVDLHDIPKIVLLISQIYHEHLLGYIIQDVGVINILKFTLDSLLDSGMIPVPEFALTIVKGIVDISLDLLNKSVHIHHIQPVVTKEDSIQVSEYPKIGQKYGSAAPNIYIQRRAKCGCNIM